MASTFFKTLKFLEETDSAGGLSKESSSVLRPLVAFIEGGCCAGSKVEKFIMENFRLSNSEMLEKWNRVNSGKVKTEETLRSQISLVSRYLLSLFGITPDELNSAFINGDVKKLDRISDILEAFEIEDSDLSASFPIIFQYNLLPNDSTDSVYEMGDCSKEIQLLKSLDRKAIESLVSEVDMDKLIYVLQTIRDPLVRDIYIKPEGKVRKVKSASVNLKKLEFCKAFGGIEPRQLKPASGIRGSDSIPDKKASKRPFALGVSDELMDMLVSGVRKYENLPPAKKLKFESRSTEESQKAASELLELFTLEGFKRQFNKLNPADLIKALEKYKTGE